jgi:uncharacterized protein
VILPDVNVLIGAFRADSPHHQLCRPWLVRTVQDNAPFGLSTQILAAVVRITTNGKIFKVPSTLEDAFGFCGDLVEQPYCRIVEPGERHWTIFQRLVIETDMRGPRVSDAWFAALAIEAGCEWITLDRDFARFSELSWSAPAAVR